MKNNFYIIKIIMTDKQRKKRGDKQLRYFISIGPGPGFPVL